MRPRFAKIETLVGEDELFVRRGLMAMLDVDDRFHLVAAVSDADQMIAAAEAVPRLDLLVADVRMPRRGERDSEARSEGREEGFRAAAEIRAIHRNVRLAFVSGHGDYPDSRQWGFSARQTGVAWFDKRFLGGSEAFVNDLVLVANGAGNVFRVPISPVYGTPDEATRDRALVRTLTKREQEVLSLMARGLDRAGIGAALVLTETGVDRHRAAIYRKLGLRRGSGRSREFAAVDLWHRHRPPVPGYPPRPRARAVIERRPRREGD